VGKVEGLIDNAEIFRKTYEIFNLQVGRPKKANIGRADARPAAELPAIDYTAYYNECRARASETDYFSFRRLSQTTIARFNLGFDPAWRSPKALREGKNPPASPRIIIPTSKHSYVARLTDPAADQKFKIVKEGKAELFNRESLWGIEPTFIVEGEIDALSIIEADSEALALGSISNKNKLVELCGVTPPLAQIVLCLDNDDRGRKTQAECLYK
jgi:replicative DNA helicase